MDTFSLNHIASLTVTVTALFFFRLVTAMDSLAPSQSLVDGNTLVSKDGTFEMGFFSPGISKNRYLGIWYKNLQEPTYVWVANRNNPIDDSSGILVFNTSGHITLVSHNNTSVVWSARLLRSKLSNPKLQLLDNGNVVLREDPNSDNFSWQSFDYPTDTLLPGMKLGLDLKNKIERNLTAWKNPNDPSSGDLTWKLEHLQFPEPIIWKGSKEYVRFSPWNGLGFSFNLVQYPILNNLEVEFINDEEEEISYQYSVQDKSLMLMIMMKLDQPTNTIYLYSRLAKSKENWNLISLVPKDYCDNYGICGPYGYCDIRETPVCVCLKGFKPKLGNGCERNKPLNCSSSVGFEKFSEMKLPDTRNTWVNRSMNLEECREKCLRNCSCMAYANTNISGSGNGCAIWIGDLIDLKIIPQYAQDLYVRLLASELGLLTLPI